MPPTSRSQNSVCNGLPVPKKLRQVPGECGRECHHGEPQRGSDKDWPTADLVGKWTEEQRPDQHTEVRGRQDRAELRRFDIPGRAQGRDDVPHRLHVEAVDDQRHQAQHEHPPLQWSDGAFREKVGDVDGVRGARHRRQSIAGARGAGCDRTDSAGALVAHLGRRRCAVVTQVWCRGGNPGCGGETAHSTGDHRQW